MLSERTEIMRSRHYVHPQAPAEVVEAIDSRVRVQVVVFAGEAGLDQSNPELYKALMRRRSGIRVQPNTSSHTDHTNLMRLMGEVHDN